MRGMMRGRGVTEESQRERLSASALENPSVSAPALAACQGERRFCQGAGSVFLPGHSGKLNALPR